MYGNIKDGADAEAEIERVCHRQDCFDIFLLPFRSLMARLWVFLGLAIERVVR